MTKSRPSQPSLPGTKSSARRRGAVERAAGADLTELRKLGVVPAGMGALTDTYRRLARAVDAADDAADGWALVNTARELRNLRAELGATTSRLEDDELASLLDRIEQALTR